MLIENLKKRNRELFEEKLDRWLQSDEHKHRCGAWDEGFSCCLDVDIGDEYYVDGRGLVLSHEDKLIEETVKAVVQEVHTMIVDEILITRKENQPTSRLTSLANKLYKLK